MRQDGDEQTALGQLLIQCVCRRFFREQVLHPSCSKDRVEKSWASQNNQLFAGLFPVKVTSNQAGLPQYKLLNNSLFFLSKVIVTVW